MSAPFPYYGWFDDDPKTPAATKVRDAAAAYERRFDKKPNVVLCSQHDRERMTADEITQVGVHILIASYIRPGNFWAGWDEHAPPLPSAMAETKAIMRKQLRELIGLFTMALRERGASDVEIAAELVKLLDEARTINEAAWKV